MANLKDTIIDGELSVNGEIGTTSTITGNTITAAGNLQGLSLKTNTITPVTGSHVSVDSGLSVDGQIMSTNTIAGQTLSAATDIEGQSLRINSIDTSTFTTLEINCPVEISGSYSFKTDSIASAQGSQVTIGSSLYITANNPSTFESSIFTTTYPHNLGYQRFDSNWIGFYQSCTAAKNNTVSNRNGYLEMTTLGATLKSEKSAVYFINSTSWGARQLKWDGDLSPGTNNAAYLGLANYKWKSVYATNGTIQTSDRSAKSDIHYIDEPQPRLKTMSLSNTTKTSFTSDDLINFIKKLNPATFVYGDGTIKDALDTNNTDSVQLGLIADDIKDESLFNYVGATCEYDDVIEPEERDEEGNIIKEAVTEKKTTLGLKPIPLAVLALTCCKKLIERIEELENNIT